MGLFADIRKYLELGLSSAHFTILSLQTFRHLPFRFRSFSGVWCDLGFNRFCAPAFVSASGLYPPCWRRIVPFMLSFDMHTWRSAHDKVLGADASVKSCDCQRAA